MKSVYYSKLALSNLKKNYRLFVPRILAEAGLIGCFYIALTLSMDKRLSEVKGGNLIPTFMIIGAAVLALLSAVLMFYINSFLMKQRKREFGIYNVLGMEKCHVAKVLFRESMLSASVSYIIGLCFGMLFYKMCSLLICRLLKTTVIVGFYFINVKSILPAFLFFAVIDLAAYGFNRISIARLNPAELISSRSSGEKEPRVKWLMLVIGILTLGGGYLISLTTVNPLSALGLFFVAVILVIIGTYLLFVTGSVFVLKLLKNNPRYYYNKKHMPAVSGLLYRMKQNAVGLASIAILATGVLVMISTTVSLYSGMQGSLSKNYPEDLYFSASYDDNGRSVSLSSQTLEDIVRQAADKYDCPIASVSHNSYLNVAYALVDDVLYTAADVRDSSISNIVDCIFLTEAQYNALTGEKLGLNSDSVAVCRISSSISGINALSSSVTLHGKKYQIKNTLAYYPIANQMLVSAFASYGFVVADNDELSRIYDAQHNAYGTNASEYTRRIAVKYESLDYASSVGDELTAEIVALTSSYIKSEFGSAAGFHVNSDSCWDARQSLLGMYGTLLFLGILLGSVCMFATVLIIYYKQISEGYEDCERFQIMEKIGMSPEEVNGTIRSQVLLVFFLPLVTAGIHMLFAYPMLVRMLSIFALYKSSLLLICTLITYTVFAALYVLIYAITSRSYYKIVHIL